MKSKGTAYLLWLLGIFGCLGFHRFYLGKIGTGLLWFFTGGLIGWGALYDLFSLGGQVDIYNLKRTTVSQDTETKNSPQKREIKNNMLSPITSEKKEPS